MKTLDFFSKGKKKKEKKKEKKRKEGEEEEEGIQWISSNTL